MLIYNHKEEFIGIDEKDLKYLGYKNLADLKQDCNDFADLFVKKPSYIHNFKNFNWIYYILHSDLNEAKVIINAKNKNFSATLELETIYLLDAPDQPAYAITLSKLKPWDSKDSSDTTNVPELKTDKIKKSEDREIPNLEDEKPVILSEPDLLETPSTQSAVENPYNFDFNAPLDVDDLYSYDDFELDDSRSPLNIYEKMEPKQEAVKPVEEKIKEKPMLGDYVHAVIGSENEYINNLKVSKDYVYDPHIASQELGLPVDLIEEFIGDFIQQSYDFKEDLYNHILTADLDNVKLLSHKLKGVAANLRIEDAFEVLSIINLSDNMDEIKANLDHFYKIISKLEGKNPEQELPIKSDDVAEKADQVKAIDTSDDDLYHIGIKYEDNEPITLENHIFEEDLKSEELDNAYYDLFDKDDQIDDQVYEAVEEAIVAENDKLDYNKKAAIDELGLSEDIVNELLSDFKEQAADIIDTLETSIENSDIRAFKKSVMSIKGAADNLRLEKISKILEELISSDNMLHANQLITSLKNYVNQL